VTDWPAAEDLVRRAQRGDSLALNDLLDLASAHVHRICRAIVPSRADDATQESLMIVFRRLRSLREPAALRGWLRVVATREALRCARLGEPERPLEHASDVLDRAPPALAGAELREGLEALSPEHRAVIVLRDVEGLSEAEIAPLLAIAPGTVKSRLHRARSRMREWLS
jgi:RNA polymerase sigma factor (sigma-70 family)